MYENNEALKSIMGVPVHFTAGNSFCSGNR